MVKEFGKSENFSSFKRENFLDNFRQPSILDPHQLATDISMYNFTSYDAIGSSQYGNEVLSFAGVTNSWKNSHDLCIYATKVLASNARESHSNFVLSLPMPTKVISTEMLAPSKFIVATQQRLALISLKDEHNSVSDFRFFPSSQPQAASLTKSVVTPWKLGGPILTASMDGQICSQYAERIMQQNCWESPSKQILCGQYVRKLRQSILSLACHRRLPNVVAATQGSCFELLDLRSNEMGTSIPVTFPLMYDLCFLRENELLSVHSGGYVVLTDIRFPNGQCTWEHRDQSCAALRRVSCNSYGSNFVIQGFTGSSLYSARKRQLHPRWRGELRPFKAQSPGKLKSPPKPQCVGHSFFPIPGTDQELILQLGSHGDLHYYGPFPNLRSSPSPGKRQLL
jgi:hypothetical protein